MKSQIKFYALASTMIFGSIVAMEQDKQENTNDNNQEQQSKFDLKKFIYLTQKVYLQEKNKEISKFDAALKYWNVLNSKIGVKESQFEELLKTIDDFAANTPKDKLNLALGSVFIDNYSPNFHKSGFYVEMQEDAYNNNNNRPNNSKNEEVAELNKLRETYNKSLVIVLVKSGADINFNGIPDSHASKIMSSLSSTASGTSLLHKAALANSVEWIKFLVSKGASLNNMDIKRRTPLLVATKNNCADVVKFLVEADNKQVNIRDINGGTPLFWAVKNNNIELAELLYLKGARLTNQFEESESENEDQEEVQEQVRPNKSGFFSKLFGGSN